MLTVTERRRWRRSALLAFASVPTAKLILPAGADARVWRPIRTSVPLFPPASALRGAQRKISSREPACLTLTLPRTRVPVCDFAIATASVACGSVSFPEPPRGGRGRGRRARARRRRRGRGRRGRRRGRGNDMDVADHRQRMRLADEAVL